MSNTDFDPDAYLNQPLEPIAPGERLQLGTGKPQGGFDPDAYLGTEPADHGLSERQKLSPVGRALSPVTDYWPTYQRMRNQAADETSQGVSEMLNPQESLTDPQAHGISEVLTGAGKAALGSVGYVASPISAAYRSFVGQPVEDVTGIPREYTEFAAQLATPYIGLAGPKLPSAPIAPPRPALPLNRFGVTESAGQASEDLPIIQAEQGAYRGQAGEPSQKHAVEFFDVQQPEQLQQAATNVSKSLDVPGTGVNPATGQPFQGQEFAQKPADAAQMVQQSLQKEAARQKNNVTDLYKYAKSLPGSIDADVFKDMPITIRDGLSNRPTDPIYVDESTPNAAKMLRYLNDRVGELKIRNDAALSSPVPSAIQGVTLEGVDQWRKAMSGFRGDAIKAAGINASDARAAKAVMDEFDSKIADAVNSGAFTGDPRAVQAYNDARTAASERFKLWGNDAIGRRLQSIIGDPRYEKDPATLNDVTRWLYGEAGSSNSLNVGTVKRIQKILGDQSPEWSAIKQGLFRQLIDKASEARGYGTIANRLKDFLNGKGSDLAGAVYSPAERDMLNAYADMYDRLNVPQAGANWPNTAAGIIPHVKHVGQRITAAIGALIGHSIWPGIGGEVGGYMAGEQVGKALTKAEEARNYKQVANLLPIISQRFKVWQQAANAQQRFHTVQTQARLTATATNLTNALSKLGGAHPNFAQILTQGPQGPGTANANEPPPRAKGGRIKAPKVDYPIDDDDADTNAFADQMIQAAQHFDAGGTPTFDERFAGIDPNSAEGMADQAHDLVTANNPPPSNDWQDQEAQANLAAIQAAKPDQGASWSDIAHNIGSGAVDMASNLAAAPGYIYNHPQDVWNDVKSVFGIGNGPRYQTWPERMIRSGGSLAHDVYTGEEPFYTTDPVSGEQVISPRVIERGLDMAGMAGTGGFANAEEGTILNATPSLRPALKYQGKIYKAPPGGEHADAMPPDLYNEYQKQALSGEDMSNFDFGFMNHKGQFLNREDALKYGIDNGLLDPHSARYGALTTPVLRSETDKPGAAVAGLSKSAEPFYSQLENVATAAPEHMKMRGSQWAGWLKNQPGVKPDELQYTGVDNWLRSQDGPVTKQQVQDYIGQNRVQLNDVVKGKVDPQQVIYQAREEFERLNPKPEDRLAQSDWKAQRDTYVDQKYADFNFRNAQTKYENWQLPGGENYREHLITLPDKNTVKARIDELENQINELYKRKDPRQAGFASAEDGILFGKLTKERSDLMKQENALASQNYKSGHWDEPNILAHVRTNERDVGGVPSLHLEELQSDWHQAGRKKGYDLSPEAKAAAEKRLNEWIDSGKKLTSEEKEEYNRLMNMRAGTGVPDAPFKKSWPELAMKRMIVQAAQEGKSRISWTPGEAQAARYDLSKSYKTINAVKKKDGSYMIQGQPAGYEASRGRTAIIILRSPPMQRLADNVPSDKLADYVGKDLAEKITDQGGGKFEGVDLKVGGEGMKGFYDQMLPKMVEKLGKQYGVKVKQEKISSAENFHQEERTGRRTQPVWYFDIPDKMKRDVLTKGFPLFSDTTHGAILNQDQTNKENIERPVQEEPKQRAKGGRVVAANINDAPSEKQKAYGNYRKDHVNIHGLSLTIENAKGSKRSGIGKDGKRWESTLHAHYGYFKGTNGADGDHVDVYLGPHPKAKTVFIVNQVDADSGKFDEHKVLMGFGTIQQAINTYVKGFSDGKGTQRIGSIVPVSMEQFKHWLSHHDTTKPFPA